MKKVIVIAGLTATGKTSTAIKLAQMIDAEIISADSVAVYKDMDIGSAKPTIEERDNIPHHLIDIVDYTDTYNVARFQRDARSLIKDIHQRNKHVIIVGGTGLYIKALLNDYRFEKEEDQDIVKRDEDTEILYQELLKLDKKSAEIIHPNNRKRIIRALDSYTKHGKTRSEITDNNKDIQIIEADVYFLQGDREKIYERINQRVEIMFKLGLEKEVKDFYDKDKTVFNYPSFSSIGYREFEDYFNEVIDKARLIELIQRNTRRFSKRQITWFKHQQEAIWIDIFEDNIIEKIIENSKLN